MNSIFIAFLSLITCQSIEGITYDVYLQLMQLQTNIRMFPYRVYGLRWEVECTSDHRQPTTKFPTAFSVDDTHLVFYDSFQATSHHEQQQQQPQQPQNFVYLRDVPEMAVICFRLFYRNDLFLEDCLVVDVRSSDFSDVRYSTTARGQGNAVTYQIQVTPSNGLYLLLMREDENGTYFTNSSVNESNSVGCIAAISIASIEAFFILSAALFGLCFYFLKTGLMFSFAKRQGMPTTGNPKSQHSASKSTHGKTAKRDSEYRAPSTSSTDSGLSNGSNPARVVIYDDPPPHFAFKTSANTTKKIPPVKQCLAEIWQRNKPTIDPPAPPEPDYKIKSGEKSNDSTFLEYDIYAALEDPNNWDPPERIVSTDQHQYGELDPEYSACDSVK